MQRKNLRNIVITLVVILAVSIWGGIQLQNGRDYFIVFRLNWDISLPYHGKLVYEVNTESGIHGDGERYHVFQYDEKPKFPEFFSEINRKRLTGYVSEAVPEEEKEEVLKILSSGMVVEEKYLPDFDGATLEMKVLRHDRSRLYLYYVESTKTLYLVEDFL